MITNTLLGLGIVLGVMGFSTLKNQIRNSKIENKKHWHSVETSLRIIGDSIDERISDVNTNLNKSTKDLKNKIMDPANKTVYIPLDLILKNEK